MTDLVRIPFRDGEVLAVEIGGKPHIVLRPALEAIGLDYSAQRRKIQGRSWATMVPVTTVAADGSRREMTVVPVRTFLMLLATINEAHVSDAVRPALIDYQNDVADVIEAYFAKEHGGDMQPFTWTLDETCAILRQRYSLRYTPVSLNAALISAGLFKQVGSPKAQYENCFYFTGSAWTVHPHMLKRVALRLLKLHRAIVASQDEQLSLVDAGRLELTA